MPIDLVTSGKGVPLKRRRLKGGILHAGNLTCCFQGWDQPRVTHERSLPLLTSRTRYYGTKYEVCLLHVPGTTKYEVKGASEISLGSACTQLHAVGCWLFWLAGQNVLPYRYLLPFTYPSGIILVIGGNEARSQYL